MDTEACWLFEDETNESTSDLQAAVQEKLSNMTSAEFHNCFRRNENYGMCSVNPDADTGDEVPH